MVFQCSSASRKFLNCGISNGNDNQRCVSVLFSEPKIPQCHIFIVTTTRQMRFSALQRAENSSMPTLTPTNTPVSGFQCSSASRKFLNDADCRLGFSDNCVSVLFSEPKIPQLTGQALATRLRLSFSALQRAENSSIVHQLPV